MNVLNTLRCMGLLEPEDTPIRYGLTPKAARALREAEYQNRLESAKLPAMNTKTKATLGAILAAVGGILVATYVPEGEARATALSALGLVVGWLGFRKPGQS